MPAPRLPLVIRDARSDDAETIVEFNVLLARETEYKELDRPTIRRGVARALAQPQMARYFVAEEAGRIIGQAMITFELTDWRDGVFWWLQSVYVAPTHRGQGVFRALFQHIAGAARADAEVRGVRLYVERDNARAQRVYEQLGMRPSGHLVYEIDWSGLGEGRPE